MAFGVLLVFFLLDANLLMSLQGGVLLLGSAWRSGCISGTFGTSVFRRIDCPRGGLFYV